MPGHGVAAPAGRDIGSRSLLNARPRGEASGTAVRLIIKFLIMGCYFQHWGQE